MRLTRVAVVAVLGTVVAAPPASAVPRNQTGQCIAETASQPPPGPPPDIAFGEPVPGENFPFTCPPPPGAG